MPAMPIYSMGADPNCEAVATGVWGQHPQETKCSTRLTPEIELVYINLNRRLGPAEMAEALYAMPKEAAQRLQRSEKVPDLMKLRVAAQLLERFVAAEYAGVPFKQAAPQRTPRGKPFLPGSGVEFNISHEDDTIALAVSRGADPVGVDIVSTATSAGWGPNWLPTFRHAFSQAEWDGIHASDDPCTAFYVYWALKEGYLKATGEGISDNMSVGEAMAGAIDTATFRTIGSLGPYAIHRNGAPTGLHGRVYRLTDVLFCAVVSPRLAHGTCDVRQLDYDAVARHFKLT